MRERAPGDGSEAGSEAKKEKEPPIVVGVPTPVPHPVGVPVPVEHPVPVATPVYQPVIK